MELIGGTTGELDELLSKIPHTYFVTCPVFGLPPVADKAQLLLAVSGGVYHARKEVAHLLCPAMGRKVIDLGERPEKGPLCIYLDDGLLQCIAAPTFKLIGNSMVMGMTEVMAEAFTLAEKAGIGADMAYGIVKGDAELASLCSAVSLMRFPRRPAPSSAVRCMASWPSVLAERSSSGWYFMARR